LGVRVLGRRKKEERHLDWKRLGNLQIIDLADVSRKGGSLYVLLPKDVADVHGIIAGDRIRVAFHDHYRKETEDEDEE
jgi:hypothetical protein